jgi:nucleoside-diphosphate-sugar epimerase
MTSTPRQHPLPDAIRDLEHLEDLLSEPSEGVIDTLRRLEGDILVLGVGGKMGPSLARMARRASEAAGVRRRVIGVSRFSSPGLPAQLNRWGVGTVSCDLLDAEQLARLPDAPNIVYLAGMKFGATGQQARTWAMNAYLPGMVCQRFRGAGRIVALSSGNVYPMVPTWTGGCTESDEPAPVGEYAMSVLGRERIFEYWGGVLGIPVALIRLNYAVEMRYGVLVDMAHKVWAGEPIDVTMGSLNAIWQADANAHTLQALDHVAAPAKVLNVTGPETLGIRQICQTVGRVMNRTPTFTGVEAGNAFLNNAQLSHRLFGYPRAGAEQVLRWTADWVMRGGESLGKPTHFETRDGKF